MFELRIMFLFYHIRRLFLETTIKTLVTHKHRGPFKCAKSIENHQNVCVTLKSVRYKVKKEYSTAKVISCIEVKLNDKSQKTSLNVAIFMCIYIYFISVLFLPRKAAFQVDGNTQQFWKVPLCPLLGSLCNYSKCKGSFQCLTAAVFLFDKAH